MEAALREFSSAAVHSENYSRCYSSTLSSPLPFQLIRALGSATDFVATAMAIAQWCHVDIPQSQFKKEAALGKCSSDHNSKKEAALGECSSTVVYSENCSRCYSFTLSSPLPFQLNRALGSATDFAATAMAIA